jgi:hypothetical protein
MIAHGQVSQSKPTRSVTSRYDKLVSNLWNTSKDDMIVNTVDAAAQDLHTSVQAEGVIGVSCSS